MNEEEQTQHVMEIIKITPLIEAILENTCCEEDAQMVWTEAFGNAFKVEYDEMKTSLSQNVRWRSHNQYLSNDCHKYCF